MSKTMNLTNKLNQEFVINKLRETDWESVNSGPLVVELDPTAVCDLACPGCISEDLVSIGNSFSNDKLLEMGQDFIECGVKAVILIGLEARPPFPQGYLLEEGDLTLLEPVYLRGKIYRD